LTEIDGYTEWVSLTNPQLTVGWDWELSYLTKLPSSTSKPFSNIMLVDNLGIDLGQKKTLEQLSKWIETLNWQSETAINVNQKYE